MTRTYKSHTQHTCVGGERESLIVFQGRGTVADITKEINRYDEKWHKNLYNERLSLSLNISFYLKMDAQWLRDFVSTGNFKLTQPNIFQIQRWMAEKKKYKHMQ